MIAICAKCAAICSEAKSLHWTRWWCLKAPNDEINYVSGECEPYHLCRFVNRNGQCPMFEEGPNILHPAQPITEAV